MISPSFTRIDERSPLPAKRRARITTMGRPEDPAITVLPPDPNMLDFDYFRCSSPGVYKAAPSKSAAPKAPSSFVILGEMLSTPVQSRPPSPSGRVSPFRGHGFKSPATSRAPSPSRSDPSKAPPPKPAPRKKLDPAGKDPKTLPPKSPAKVRARPANLKNGTVQKTNLGVDTKAKPSRTPRPGRKQLKMANNVIEDSSKTQPSSDKPELANTVEENEIIMTETPKGADMKEVSQVLKNLVDGNSGSGRTSEDNSSNAQVEGKADLKNMLSAVTQLSGKTNLPNVVAAAMSSAAAASQEGGKSDLSKAVTTTAIIVDVKEKDPAPVTAPEEPKKNDSEVLVSEEEAAPDKADKAPETMENGKLTPCFQPDKCHIAPPTMASPSPIIASAINAPPTTSGSALTKTTESSDTSHTTVTTTSLNALSAAATISGNLARRSHALRKPSLLDVPGSLDGIRTSNTSGTNPAPELDTSTHVKSSDPAISPAWMPPETEQGSPVNQSSLLKPSNNSSHEDVISTTNLIKVDSELELLSANNLRDSPPRRQPNPAWNEERLVNGDVPNNSAPRGKLRRFFAGLWSLIKYLFCCRCFLDCFRRAKCCRTPRCCRKIEDPVPTRKLSCFDSFKRHSCCGPSNCFRFCQPCNCCRRCGSSNCSRCCGSSNSSRCCGPCGCFRRCGGSDCCKCKKLKCCEGRKCCKRRSEAGPQTKRKCCAKPNCSCKDCCAKMKSCCVSCGDKVNAFFRALFCLNLVCCQKCLGKCCKPCHRMKCCQKGGCCSCFNPNVRKERQIPKLDKRASTQSKSGKTNLDPVLVEHMSLMKAAIPVLPTSLAFVCLMLNLFFPGSGTFTSGLFCLCFGKPRFSVTDSAKNRIGSFCVNLIIGIAQLFTIVFCLVGWGWSIWWGVIMYKLARKQKRIKLAEKSTQEAKEAANKNHVDVEKG